MRKHQLIGSEVSLYTGKLRCYLQNKKIPYQEILASAQIYQDVIIPRTGVKYIPVLITDDDRVLQDSTDIIDHLEARYPHSHVYPSSPCQKLVALLLEVFGDEWLVIPAMHYRWNFQENRDFAMAEFGRTTAPQVSKEQQISLGKKVATPFKGALPALGVMPHLIPAIEKSYLALLGDLNTHFLKYDYLLGKQPCIGDFGLIGPLYAHLYRDPLSGRLMKKHAPHVAAWVERMIKPATRNTGFLPNDEIPNTLMPILERLFSELGPAITQTIEQVAAWGDKSDDEKIPRTIGELKFNIEGVEGTRLTFPYMQWMWQRVTDHYHDKNAPQNEMARLLSPINGALELLNTPIRHRVFRHNNKLRINNPDKS